MATDVTSYATYWDVVLDLKHGCRFWGSYPEDRPDSDEECMFCCEPLKESFVVRLACGHCFHRNCIYENLFVHEREYCPQCPKKIIGEPVVMCLADHLTNKEPESEQDDTREKYLSEEEFYS